MNAIVAIVHTNKADLTDQSHSKCVYDQDTSSRSLSTNVLIYHKEEKKVLWQTILSSSTLTVTLPADVASGDAILLSGATLELNQDGNFFQILFTGTITGDNPSPANFTKKVLSTFSVTG